MITSLNLGVRLKVKSKIGLDYRASDATLCDHLGEQRMNINEERVWVTMCSLFIRGWNINQNEQPCVCPCRESEQEREWMTMCDLHRDLVVLMRLGWVYCSLQVPSLAEEKMWGLQFAQTDVLGSLASIGKATNDREISDDSFSLFCIPIRVHHSRQISLFLFFLPFAFAHDRIGVSNKHTGLWTESRSLMQRALESVRRSLENRLRCGDSLAVMARVRNARHRRMWLMHDIFRQQGFWGFFLFLSDAISMMFLPYINIGWLYLWSSS
jgi:hypothetical protein